MIEESTEEFAPAYKMYGAGGYYLGEVQMEFNGKPASEGYITFGGSMKLVPFGNLIKDYDGYYIYSVSAVTDGIESPRVNCDFNTHNTLIALDTDGNGKIERIMGEFAFDFNADGEKTTVSQWFAAKEGILVDTRSKGEISGEHLFGDMGGQFAEGFAKLATWDLNQDGKVQGGELNRLGIWTGANSNAHLDVGELSSLSQYSIISLSTHHNALFSTAQLENGKTMLMEDVLFPTAAHATELSRKPSSVLAFLSMLGVVVTGLGLWCNRDEENRNRSLKVNFS